MYDVCTGPPMGMSDQAIEAVAPGEVMVGLPVALTRSVFWPLWVQCGQQCQIVRAVVGQGVWGGW
jgi:hypothetical protein